MKKTLGIIVILALAGSLIYFNYNSISETLQLGKLADKKQNKQDKQDNKKDKAPKGKQENDKKEDNWINYKSTEFGFSLSYKSGFQISKNETSNSIKFMLTGPTQKANTDLYDGIYLNIRKGNLNGNNLKEFVKNKVEETKQIGKIISPMTGVNFKGFSGYKYTANTLGESRNIYISVEDDKFLSFSYFAEDPENQGFQKVLDKMLDSIKIAKPFSGDEKSTKMFNNSSFDISFEYPEILKVSTTGNNIILKHSIDYEHNNPCDFKGKNPTLQKLEDFHIKIKETNNSLSDLIKENETDRFAEKYLSGNNLKEEKGFIEKVSFGSLNGYKIKQGVENCGRYTYYIPLNGTTLRIERKMISEFKVGNQKEELTEKENIITPNKEQEIFENILKSLEK